VKRAVLALAALVASTVALGQQTTQRTPAQRHTSTTSQEQRAPRMSEADKLTLINDCTRQVQAAHPSVPEKEVKTYCEDRLKSYLYLSQR
jgi:Tfp pilus assembly protein PilV